jgi:hypothetical protein
MAVLDHRSWTERLCLGIIPVMNDAKQVGDRDFGLEALDTLIQDLGLAGPALSRHERGFSWQGKRLRLEVLAEPMRSGGGLEACRLSSRTHVLSEVHDTPGLYDYLDDLNRGTAMGAWSFDPEARQVQLTASVQLQAGDRHFWETWFLLALALQLAQAEAQWEDLEAAFGGRLGNRTGDQIGDQDGGQIGDEPADSTRPVDAASDPLAAVLGEIILAGRASASPIEPSALSEAALAERSRWILPMADARGLSALLPFDPTMRVGEFFAEVEAGGENPHCARLRMDLTQPHPHLGAGLLCLLELPPKSALPPAFVDAQARNLAAARDGTTGSQIGSWCGGERPTFVAFIPALLLLAAADEIEEAVLSLLDVLAIQIEQSLAT